MDADSLFAEVQSAFGGHVNLIKHNDLIGLAVPLSFPDGDGIVVYVGVTQQSVD